MTFHKSIRKFFSIAVMLLVAVLVVGCTSENVAEQRAELIYIGSKDAVNGSFALPKFVQGEEDAPIEWTSSNTTALNIEEFADWDDAFDHSKFIKAKVVLAPTEVELELTAVVTVGKDKATVKFPVTVVADLYAEKTISEAKAMSLKSLVKLTGTVSYTGDSGYIIVNEDGTDQMFVYRGTGTKVGDVVVVRGETAEYQKMPQLASSAFEKIDQVTFDADEEAEVMTLAEVNSHSNTDKSFYSKLVKLEGLLVKTTDSNKPWVIQDPLDAGVKVFINKYTSAKSAETINANLNKFITVNAVLYDNRDNTFTLLLPDTFPAGTTYEYDDEKNAIRTLNELVAQFNDAIVTEDLVLPVEVEDRGATIAWESSNPEVLAIDGTVNTPTNDTAVTLTITVTVGEETQTGTVEVTVKQLPVSTAAELIDLTPAKASDPKILVAAEGVVIGIQYGGYYVADETGAVLVYTGSSGAKPTVGQVVKVVGELTTYKDTEQFTTQIVNSTFTVLEKEAPTVIAPAALTWSTIFGLGIDTYAEAKEQAKVYYGKYFTITGTVVRPGSNLNYWRLVNPNDATQFIRLESLDSNALLIENKDKTVTMTLIFREINYINDPGQYNNFVANTFGGTFFTTNVNLTVVE